MVQVYQLSSWQQACSHLVISCEYLFQNIFIIIKFLFFSPINFCQWRREYVSAKAKLKCSEFRTLSIFLRVFICWQLIAVTMTHLRAPLIMVLSTRIKCMSSYWSVFGIYNNVGFNSLNFFMHICICKHKKEFDYSFFSH